MSESVLGEISTIHYGQSPTDVLAEDGQYPIIGTGGEYGRASVALFDAGIVVPRKGSLGNPQLLEKPFWPVDTTFAVIPKKQIDARWLYYNLLNFDLRRLNEATGVPSINRSWLARLRFNDPGYEGQKNSAKILYCIDQTIESTQALIEKYQLIKAGLMHDLFTRGIGADGKLRPPREAAPELYQETAIGWIPKEWTIHLMTDVLESVVDGPFGSNLKTEHYVTDAGVRVVRLQNVTEYKYNDADKTFISERHAASLYRNKVISGDVLIAGLGEERYPVGRSCVYSEDLPPAINKADCFRARCNQNVLLNKFLMLFLNSSYARTQVRRYEQGVTRPRINTGNLKRLFVTVPDIIEQELIVEKFESIQAILSSESHNFEKKIKQKAGLMHDLLTGKAQVKVDDTEVNDA